MKAILMTEYGGPEVLDYGDAPDPRAGAGEIVVDILAASVNPADWKAREGQRRNLAEYAFPHIPGFDFSGVVSEVGDGVGDFKPGDAVFAVTNFGSEGAYAEMIAFDAALAAPKPESLSHDEAAALALVGLTAILSLDDAIGLQSGETVLIHGGAGGVGGFAIQFAKHLGAQVYTTASAANHDYVLGLGADAAIDYNSRDFTEAVPQCDAVFDTIGGDVHARSFRVLKPGGRLAWVAPPPPGFVAPRDDVQVLRPSSTREKRHLVRIAELVAAGAVTPPAIQRMPLAEAAAAQELSKTGHVRGKVVLDVR
jgi:NADPH:quinone reductase-like Zn-dependent oxidoreductase